MKAILFDLDGTLLPLDEKLFVDIYFTELKMTGRELMKRLFGRSLRVL